MSIQGIKPSKDQYKIVVNDGSGWDIKIHTRFKIGEQAKVILSSTIGVQGYISYTNYCACFMTAELFSIEEVKQYLIQKLDIYINAIE